MYSSFIFTEDRLGIKLNALKDEKGNIWFIGKEVAEIFGYVDTKQVIRNSVLKEDKILLTGQEFRDFVGGAGYTPQNNKVRNIILITESGLYDLALNSKKKEAKEFRRWVTKEVLPSLRKNNYYIDKENINTPQLDNLQKELDTLRKEKDVYIKDSNFYSIRDIKELLGGESIGIDTNKLKEMSYKLKLSVKQEEGYFNSKLTYYNRYHFLVWAKTYEDIFEITSDEKLRIKNTYDELNNNVCL